MKTTFDDEANKFGSFFKDEVVWAWTQADIMEQPETPENAIAKEAVKRLIAVEKERDEMRDEYERRLTELSSMAAGRGKFG